MAIAASMPPNPEEEPVAQGGVEADVPPVPVQARAVEGAGSQPEETKAEKIMKNKYFKYVIWVSVMLSLILMCIDSPHTSYAEYGAKWTVGNWKPDLLNSLELICVLIFTFEAFVLILGKGWRPYFTNPRNAVQFFIVIASWIKVLIHFGGGKATGGPIVILGTIRALRPWLVLSLQPDMNDIFLCLFKAIKALTSILSIMIFFFVIFGLIGMQLFPRVLQSRCTAPGSRSPA